MGRRAVALAGLLALAATACYQPQRSWAYTTRVEPDAATLVWQLPAAATVACRDGAGRSLPLDATSVSRRGDLRLQGLTADTRYRCRLLPAGAPRPLVVRFRTPPASAARFRFAVVGDTGDNSAGAAAVARRIRASRPAFLVHLGDFAYPAATAPQLDNRFFRIYARTLARMPIYPVPGNHDLTWRSVWSRVFAPVHASADSGRHYGFAWAGTQFVMLTSEDLTGADSDGARWLAAHLDALSHDAWRIVAVHEPPYTPGPKYVTPGLRAAMASTQRTHVDLVLAGHEHLYARSEPVCELAPPPGVVHVLSGGGGGKSLDRAAPRKGFPVVVSQPHFLRVSVTRDVLDIRAVDLDGQSLDHVRLRRGTPGPCRADGWPLPIER